MSTTLVTGSRRFVLAYCANVPVASSFRISSSKLRQYRHCFHVVETAVSAVRLRATLPFNG
jgi:hypothetical protein